MWCEPGISYRGMWQETQSFADTGHNFAFVFELAFAPAVWH
jgi:hypothetical protein